MAQSSSDSEMYEISEKDSQQIDVLQAQLQENPESYDCIVQLITLLRKCHLMGRLRDMRQHMQKRYPLTEALWLEWIEDEDDEDDDAVALSRLVPLFECAVGDYLSIPLWLKYITLVTTRNPEALTPVGMTRAREVCERAVAAGGAHWGQGTVLWSAYIAFEQVIFSILADGATDNMKEQEAQKDRIRSIYLRQLDLPLDGVMSTFEAYCDWEHQMADGAHWEPSLNLVKHIKRVKKQADLLRSYEQGLADHHEMDPAAVLTGYLSYLDVSEQALKKHTPRAEEETKEEDKREVTNEIQRIIVLYERVLALFPLTDVVWRRYCLFVLQHERTRVESVLKRSLRNCPWVGGLWKLSFMYCWEEKDLSFKAKRSMVDTALQSGLQTQEDYLEVMTAYVSGLKNEPIDIIVDQVREFAVLLSQLFPEDADPAGRIARLLVCTLRHHHSTGKTRMGAIQKNSRDPEDSLEGPSTYTSTLESRRKAEAEIPEAVAEREALKDGREVLLGSAVARHAGTWLAFFDEEKQRGQMDEVRTLIRRSLKRNVRGDGLVQICRYWLLFEEECGGKYLDALVQVQPFLTQSLSEAQSTYDRMDVFRGTGGVSSVPAERRLGGAVDQGPFSRGSGGKRRLREEHEMERNQNAKKKKKMKTTQKSLTGALEYWKDQNTGRTKQEASSAPRPTFDKTSPCTVFVKHLWDDVDKRSLHEKFAEFGEVLYAKIDKDSRSGRYRDYAYVMFATKDAARAACQSLNGQQLAGEKTLFVALSKPPEREKNRSSKNVGAPRTKKQLERNPQRGGTQRQRLEESSSAPVLLPESSSLLVPRSLQQKKTNEEVRQEMLKKY